MKGKKSLYGLYRKLEDVPAVATAASFVYTRLRPALQCPEPLKPPTRAGSGLPVVAFVCDEMTWQDYKNECRAVFVTPKNWRRTFERHRPGLFFCEAAWSGIDGYRDCWRGKIYKNDRICYNNRRELFEILTYCREHSIPTVFWNKEDPGHFDDARHNFVDTALQFDHILTTAAECLPRYTALGARAPQVWMFAFSSTIYYPPAAGRWTERDNTAVFAGSWYAEMPHRCRDMERLLDAVLAEGVRPVIHDRHSGSGNPDRRFPDKYAPYLRPAVAFAELGDIYRRSRYVINLNSATGSETMFARRVFEAMACGCVVVSNPSAGMEKLFPERVWLPPNAFDFANAEEIARQNAAQVFESNTCAARMRALWDITGIEVNP